MSAPADPVRPPLRPSRTTIGDRVRWALVLGWVAFAVAVPLRSDRIATWDQLTAAVGSGQVREVSITRELPSDLQGGGSVHVQFRWKDGPWHRIAEITQVVKGTPVPGEEGSTPVDGFDDEFDSGNGGGFSIRIGYDSDPLTSSARVRGVPSTELRALQPTLTVRHDRAYEQGLEAWFGFAVPQILTGSELALVLISLLVLIGGPQPWRATKWAWFWLFALPFGAAAFAVLAGPLRPLPAPADPARRLTGGWSFLLVLVVSSVWVGVS